MSNLPEKIYFKDLDGEIYGHPHYKRHSLTDIEYVRSQGTGWSDADMIAFGSWMESQIHHSDGDGYVTWNGNRVTTADLLALFRARGKEERK